MASSTRIHSSKRRAASTASSSPARSAAFDTPTEEPRLAGFTKQG